jgi:hypothetical protein
MMGFGPKNKSRDCRAPFVFTEQGILATTRQAEILPGPGLNLSARSGGGTILNRDD